MRNARFGFAREQERGYVRLKRCNTGLLQDALGNVRTRIGCLV